MDELKPCPFCGAENRGDILEVYPSSPSLGRGHWAVRCDGCGAEGPTVNQYNSENPDELCERAWNTRADAMAADKAEIASLQAQLAQERAKVVDAERGALERAAQVADRRSSTQRALGRPEDWPEDAWNARQVGIVHALELTGDEIRSLIGEGAR